MKKRAGFLWVLVVAVVLVGIALLCGCQDKKAMAGEKEPVAFVEGLKAGKRSREQTQEQMYRVLNTHKRNRLGCIGQNLKVKTNHNYLSFMINCAKQETEFELNKTKYSKALEEFVASSDCENYLLGIEDSYEEVEFILRDITGDCLPKIYAVKNDIVYNEKEIKLDSIVTIFDLYSHKKLISFKELQGVGYTLTDKNNETKYGFFTNNGLYHTEYGTRFNYYYEIEQNQTGTLDYTLKFVEQIVNTQNSLKEMNNKSNITLQGANFTSFVYAGNGESFEQYFEDTEKLERFCEENYTEKIGKTIKKIPYLKSTEFEIDAAQVYRYFSDYKIEYPTEYTRVVFSRSEDTQKFEKWLEQDSGFWVKYLKNYNYIVNKPVQVSAKNKRLLTEFFADTQIKDFIQQQGKDIKVGLRDFANDGVPEVMFSFDKKDEFGYEMPYVEIFDIETKDYAEIFGMDKILYRPYNYRMEGENIFRMQYIVHSTYYDFKDCYLRSYLFVGNGEVHNIADVGTVELDNKDYPQMKNQYILYDIKQNVFTQFVYENKFGVEEKEKTIIKAYPWYLWDSYVNLPAYFEAVPVDCENFGEIRITAYGYSFVMNEETQK